MAWFRSLQEKGVLDVVSEVFAQIREAETHRDLEIKSAIRIQSWIRGVHSRKHIHHLHNAAVEIQRCLRGFVDRRSVRKLMFERDLDRKMAVFHAAATLIQKIFRGFHSRATRVDFYKRKRYIEQVFKTSSELRLDLQQQFERQIQQEQEREEEAAAEEFDKVTGSLHHLLSTSVRPGIFRSPYGEAYSATAFDIPVEKHIEDSFKSHFERSKVAKKTSRRAERKTISTTKRPKAATKPKGKSVNPVASYRTDRGASSKLVEDFLD